MSLNRRHFVGLSFLALAGCGFTPVYGGAHGKATSAALDSVKIDRIPDRPGQLLQQALQQDFYTDGQPVQELYLLTVNYSINQLGQGIQADSSSSRTRFSAVAAWRLAPIGKPSQTLATGSATAVAALNIIDQQYFAVNLETQTVNQELANQISAQVTAQVAAWFAAHPRP